MKQVCNMRNGECIYLPCPMRLYASGNATICVLRGRYLKNFVGQRNYMRASGQIFEEF